jgi:hypothetical protein
LPSPSASQTSDLDDPIESLPDLNEPADEADQLLADMADDAIDRMLAGGAIDTTPPAPPVPAEEASGDDPDAAENDALLTDAERAALDMDAAPQLDDEVSEEDLDRLLRGETTPNPTSDADAVAGELDATAAIDAQFATTSVASPAAEAEPAAAYPSTWWVKPFIWLDAPLNKTAPSTRDSVGKIAIVTGLNAVAVIAYVVVFRG